MRSASGLWHKTPIRSAAGPERYDPESLPAVMFGASTTVMCGLHLIEPGGTLYGTEYGHRAIFGKSTEVTRC